MSCDLVKTRLSAGVGSRSRRINQLQCSTPGLVISWFFRFCFRLRQISFHWNISDGVVKGIWRNRNILIFPTPISLTFSDSTYDSDFRLSHWLEENRNKINLKCCRRYWSKWNSWYSGTLRTKRKKGRRRQGAVWCQVREVGPDKLWWWCSDCVHR